MVNKLGETWPVQLAYFFILSVLEGIVNLREVVWLAASPKGIGSH